MLSIKTVVVKFTHLTVTTSFYCTGACKGAICMGTMSTCIGTISTCIGRYNLYMHRYIYLKTLFNVQ